VWCDSHKKNAGTRYVEHVFLHPVGSAGHIVHFSVFALRNIDTIFFIPRWAWCRTHKKCAVTRNTELGFLEHMRSAGHVVRSGAFG
jgi:hypothetical protein